MDIFAVQVFNNSSKEYKITDSVSISTDQGIYSFFKNMCIFVKTAPVPVFKVTMMIFTSVEFASQQMIESRGKLYDKWKNIPDRFFPKDYTDLIPYARKLLCQYKYPLSFRICFETSLEHEKTSMVDLTMKLCEIDHKNMLFHYETMGDYQLYPMQYDRVATDIWGHMRLNFIYFLKICQLEAACSQFCEFQLLAAPKRKKPRKPRKKKILDDRCLLCERKAVIHCCLQYLYCMECATTFSKSLGYISCWGCKTVLFPK